MRVVVEEDEADVREVGEVVHDELLAGGADEVPVVPHVHHLRVLQHDHVLGRGLPRHREPRDREVGRLGRVQALEVLVAHHHALDGVAAAEGVVAGGDGHGGHARVEVLEDSVSEAHPLVGDHLAELRGVGGREEGVGQVDELAGVAAAERLLGPGEAAVHRVVPANKDIPSLRE